MSVTGWNPTVLKRESAGMPYRVTEGDSQLQDFLFRDETIRRGISMLNEYAGGNLAYTPEMAQRFREVLQRRYETDDGTGSFEVPNYAVYEDPDMAAFYGVDTSQVENIQVARESFDSQVERLLRDTARELEVEMAGLAQQMQNFRNEEWARYGVFEEKPYVHADPDVTLFRNPGRGWCTIDRPAATSDKTNIIDLYDAQPDFTFSIPHEGWTVDRRNGFWDNQASDTPPALGFY